jgi:hypothetical protein
VGKHPRRTRSCQCVEQGRWRRCPEPRHPACPNRSSEEILQRAARDKRAAARAGEGERASSALPRGGAPLCVLERRGSILSKRGQPVICGDCMLVFAGCGAWGCENTKRGAAQAGHYPIVPAASVPSGSGCVEGGCFPTAQSGAREERMYQQQEEEVSRGSTGFRVCSAGRPVAATAYKRGCQLLVRPQEPVQRTSAAGSAHAAGGVWNSTTPAGHECWCVRG